MTDDPIDIREQIPEADRLEQQADVPVDDEDDYQHEVLATG